MSVVKQNNWTNNSVYIILCILFGSMFMITAIIGFRGLRYLSMIAVPALAILLITAAYYGIRNVNGFENIWRGGIKNSTTMSFRDAITLTVGSWISGCVLTADIARFAKNEKVVVTSSLVGFTFGNTWVMLTGALCVVSFATGDIFMVLLGTGSAIFAYFALLASSWTSADNDLYAAGLALSKIFCVKKWKSCLIGGIIGIIFACLKAQNYFVPFMIFLGRFIPPIAGILLFDYFILNKRSYKEKKIKRFNWAAILGWAIATIMDYFLFTKIGITGINAMILAPIIYFVIIKISENKVKKVSS